MIFLFFQFSLSSCSSLSQPIIHLFFHSLSCCPLRRSLLEKLFPLTSPFNYFRFFYIYKTPNLPVIWFYVYLSQNVYSTNDSFSFTAQRRETFWNSLCFYVPMTWILWWKYYQCCRDRRNIFRSLLFTSLPCYIIMLLNLYPRLYFWSAFIFPYQHLQTKYEETKFIDLSPGSWNLEPYSETFPWRNIFR